MFPAIIAVPLTFASILNTQEMETGSPLGHSSPSCFQAGGGEASPRSAARVTVEEAFSDVEEHLHSIRL